MAVYFEVGQTFFKVRAISLKDYKLKLLLEFFVYLILLSRRVH
jgi:hypothetical protein